MIDLSSYKNILKCIRYCESLDNYQTLQCKLDKPYKKAYDIILFLKDHINNKVISIQLLMNKKQNTNHNINFDILPSKDKEIIDKNINITFDITNEND